MKMEFKLSEQVRLKHDKVSDNYYLFCIKDGKHFRLNQTSYEILLLVEEGISKNEIAKWISKNYNVDTNFCKNDINELFNVLIKEGLGGFNDKN